MGRGNRTGSTRINKNQQLAVSKPADNIKRDYPELDETPYLEKWYSLNEFVDYQFPAYVSVEPRPKHYEIEADWKYRAVIHIGYWEEQRKYERRDYYGDTPAEAVRLAAEDLGEIVFEPDLNTIEPKTIGLNPTIGANVYSDPNKNYALFNHYKDNPDWRKNHIRIKNVPKPKEVGEITWYSEEFIESRDTGSPGDEFRGTDESYSYTENGFKAVERRSVSRSNYSIKDKLPTNFPSNKIPDEVFIVAKRCDTGDTFSSSQGRMTRLFAFDSLEAAEEYASYRYPELAAGYFDSGQMVIISSKGNSIRSETLYFDED